MALKLDDFRRLDINYRYFHGSLSDLMGRAGESVASTVKAKFGVGNRILVVCGTGNKAGDGLVAAESLRSDNTVTVMFAKGRVSVKKAEAKNALEKYQGEIAEIGELDRYLAKSDIVIDALLGTGISGDPKSPYDEIITKVNDSKSKKVSIDLPSGFRTSRGIRPEVTVTFHDIKEGMNPDNSGEIEMVDIGIPKGLNEMSGPGDFIFLREAKPDSHKGMNDVLGIIGGWTYHGSAVIASQGALGTGPDLVNIVIPPERYELISTFSPEIITRPYVGPDRLAEDIRRYSALVIGPGLGEDKDIRKMLLKLIPSVKVPAVIDADAIRMLSGEEDLFSNSPFVFTPHRKEFEVLTGTEATEENIMRFASRTGTVVVLKGKTDLISDGTSIYRTEGGNARLTMGGTGDLLAGIIGGLLSRGMGTVEASRLGTFIIKKAAAALFEDKAYWYGIQDLIDEIPYTMKETWEFCRD